MKNKKKSDKLFSILIIVIFVAGLSLLLYPAISNAYNSWLQSRAIVDYSTVVDSMEQETYQKELTRAQAYNTALNHRESPFELTPELEEQYWQTLNLSGKNIMAYVQIPSIDVTLPIAHGSSEETLQKYVGHLEWSSLLVGGESTHCVISGHRGLPSSELFTNIDHLELGDRFYIHVLGQTLEYQVCHIAVVEPTDQKLLTAVEGQDLVTLVTCTPYGINSHRLLVRGIRTGTAGAAEQGGVYVKNEVTNIDPVILAVAALVVIAVAGFIVLLLTTGKKQKKEAPDGEEPKE